MLKTRHIVDVSNDLLNTMEAYRPKVAAGANRSALAMENHKFTLAIDEHHPVSHLAYTPGAALILHVHSFRLLLLQRCIEAQHRSIDSNSIK